MSVLLTPGDSHPAPWVHGWQGPHTPSPHLWCDADWSEKCRVACSMVMVLPMLWFTLGINKSQPGSRFGSWIAICYLHLSSPLLAPILAVHGSSLAPIYHDIYGMCQTNIQQEIVSWHKLLFAFPYHLFLNWKQEMVTWKQNTYFPKWNILLIWRGSLNENKKLSKLLILGMEFITRLSVFAW